MYGESYEAREVPIKNSERRPGHCQTTRIGTRQDYAALAKLADETGIKFHRLAERFEEGTENVEVIRARLVHATPEIPTDGEVWVLHDDAERILPGVYDALRKLGTSAIRRKPNGLGPTGCGWLWHLGDLLSAAEIARQCRLQTMPALRAMQAIR